jgi:Zn-dependent metalloprotease
MIKKVLGLLVLIVVSFFGSLFGQEELVEGRAAENFLHGAELIRYTKRSSLPNYVQMRETMELPPALIESTVKKIYRLDEDGWFSLQTQRDDALGFVHARYQQMEGQIPVEGGNLILHLKNGGMYSINGDAFEVQNLSQTPALAVNEALRIALAHVNADRYLWEDEAETRLLRTQTGDPMATWYPVGKLVFAPKGGIAQTGNFTLAWKFDIYAITPLYRAFVYVDAQTGEVIWEQNRIHTADVLGSAVTRYSGTVPMTADQVSANSFRLREAGRGNGMWTQNLATGTNYGNAIDFTDANNIWANSNAAHDEVATDAHWGAEKTYDFYWNNFSRNSIDGNGFHMYSYVHYGQNYNNAFWDGFRMTYGDGNGTSYFPFTALDVTGHEITHGITEFTAGLAYSYESGALNESFSDIFGNSIEHYARPSQWSWKIGEDMTSSGNGLRNMQNPALFNDPDTYLGNFWYTGTGDNGGVHTNSGVQNKWFYILTIGESGTNDIGSTYNVPAQGWTKSQAIAYRNLTVYLTANSDYADARFYAIRSAGDLYGPCTPEVIATTNAWYAVGVGPAFSNTILADFSATPSSLCYAPATVAFTNTSINGGTYSWSFGDGWVSSAVSPQHTYTQYGSYTVRLIANGGPCGIDTLLRTAYIVIDTNLACSINLNPTGGNTLQTACAGTVYDSGGPNGNYTDNTNTTITIAPTGASQVTLHFVSFAMELNYDYLYVYDGPNINSPLIGTYSGTTLPANISSTGGSITIRQFSDPGVVDAGFEIHWLCALPNSAPTVNFTADNLTSCNGIVNFRDLSNNGPTTWAWTFGDGFTSTQQHPAHTYQSNGVYTVTLTATNSFGPGSLTRTAYVTVNKPNGPNAPARGRCGPGTVTLYTIGAGIVSWYNSAQGGIPVGTGSNYLTPVLTNSTVYYAEEQTPAPSQDVGPTSPLAVGAGGYHNNTSVQYLTFTVSSPLTLVSVYVDPGAAGNRTITLWDGSGILIRDTTQNISANPGRITLNWTMTPGTYRIGGSNMDLYRNNAGPTYPYALTNFVSITGSSAGSGFYYYFYDWEVKGQACVSQRTAVPVTIVTDATAAFSWVANQLTHVFTDQSTGGTTSWLWRFGDGASSGTQNPSHTYAAAGTYNVVLRVENANGCRDTLTQTVNVSFVANGEEFGAAWDKLQVSPNPFESSFMINMTLPEAGALKITTFDALGKLVGTLYDGEAAAGEFQLRTDYLANQVAAGTYLLRIEYGGERRVLRLVKM